MDTYITRELEKLDPSVPFRASRSHLHHTWAKTFFCRPELYIQPESVEELRKAVTLARRCRRRVVSVGSGHSPSDLTCTSSWIINLDKLSRILEFDSQTGLVKVEAGIRLHDLGVELEKRGLMLPNLGSIDHQSIAGVISTGTHGSSLKYGLLSECVSALSIMLANGQIVRCDPMTNQSLFRAALLSLGALGIITEMTLKTVPAFNILWRQSLHSLPEVLGNWQSGLWTSTEYARVWWMPYMKRAIVWKADKTELPLCAPPSNFYGGLVGYHVYHNLLYLANWLPRILPWIEWFVFGMQYGFRPGGRITEAVEPARTGLLMNCLYSQFVNEWALPLEKGPEAIDRLSAWLNGDTETANIPFSPKGLWVHCPIEVRVADTTKANPHPYLDPTCRTGPTLFLNATLYRPYHRDPPCVARYYEAFEWLMRDMGGRPHWAKNFTASTDRKELATMYSDDLKEWLHVRDEVDSDGMFLGEWHRRNLLSPLVSNTSVPYPIEEREYECRHFEGRGAGDGLEWIGRKAWICGDGGMTEPTVPTTAPVDKLSNSASSSPPTTAASEESFDHLARVEASIVLPERE